MKGMRKLVLYKNHCDSQPPKIRWSYMPHRSKVKGKIKANLFKIMIRTPSCAYRISWKCNIAATPDQQPKSKTFLGTSKELAWGCCWRSLNAKSDHQLYSQIKENYTSYSHICITNLVPFQGYKFGIKENTKKIQQELHTRSHPALHLQREPTWHSKRAHQVTNHRGSLTEPTYQPARGRWSQGRLTWVGRTPGSGEPGRLPGLLIFGGRIVLIFLITVAKVSIWRDGGNSPWRATKGGHPHNSHTPHLKPLSYSLVVTCNTLASGARLVISLSEYKSSLGRWATFSLGMALYSAHRYSTHNIELIHGYLAIFIVCYAMSYAPSSYITMFSLALSINIGLVCLRACSSSMPIHHHGEGFGGARVVILCTRVVPKAWRIHRIWLHPTVCRVGGRWWQPCPSFVVPYVRMWSRSLKCYSRLLADQY
jgi:hypothetical protein